MRRRFARGSTLNDVAVAAGVSKATVSNILRGRGGVYATETIHRVQKIAEDLRYVPNVMARNLAAQRTHILEVIWTAPTDLRRQFYFLEVLAGIMEATGSRGYQITLSHRKHYSFGQTIAQLESGLVEGAILIAPPPNDDVLRWIQETRYPAVLVGEYSGAADTEIVSIDVDNEGAVYTATRYLIEQGHRHIGFINGDRNRFTPRWREAGYQRALREAGIGPRPEWTREEDFSEAVGRRFALELHDAHPELTAIVCATDTIALGAIQALQERGVRVPDDISLVGFDDVDAASRTTPALTTVHQPLFEIGKAAVDALLCILENGETPPSRLLPGRLIVRDSVRPLAKSD
jgi:LacI family transcriptional regulator